MKQSDDQSTLISDQALEMVMFDLLNGLKGFALERAFAKAKADLATLPQKWTQVKKCAELKLGHTVGHGCSVETLTNSHQVVTVSALEQDSTKSERFEKRAEKIIQFPTSVGPVGPAKITT